VTEPLYKQKWKEFLDAYEDEFLNGGCKDILVEEFKKCPDRVLRAYYELSSNLTIYLIADSDDMPLEWYEVLVPIESRVHDERGKKHNMDFFEVRYFGRWGEDPEQGYINSWKKFYDREQECSDIT